MKTEFSATAFGKRFTTVAAAMLVGSAALTLVPTTASAFDIGGLIGTAIAVQMGGHHSYAPSHHRTHVASRHDRDSSSSKDEEKDARDVDVTPQNGSKVSQRAPSGPSQNTEQASAPDPTASKVAADEPAFKPAR